MAVSHRETPLRHRMVGAALTWVVAVGVAVAAAHPESCPTASPAGIRAAAEAAVTWLAANQHEDGSFLYRYDRDQGRDLGGYNIVRHAGVLLSLAQAEAHGIEPAGEAFRAGRRWADERIVDVGAGSALAEGATADTGAAALLTAALLEWREATGDHLGDELLEHLGVFLTERVTDDGAVIAAVDLRAGRDIEDARSPFSTGETAWALAALHTAFPDGGWDAPARRVTGYLAGDRDDVERRFPPVSDHWAAYALAEIGAEWPAPLTPAEQRLARRQAGLFGLQIRYESQRRRSGVVRWTRGPTALGAGVGTLGEGLGALARLAAADETTAENRSTIVERLRCVVGTLVDRQVSAQEAAGRPDTARLVGAWFRQGVTQMDDQQHALSALLAALEGDERPAAHRP